MITFFFGLLFGSLITFVYVSLFGTEEVDYERIKREETGGDADD